MKCQICDKYFFEETSFRNLLNFSDICQDCLLKYQPKLDFETIPIDRGMVKYYYLYRETSLNIKQQIYLNKHIDYLYSLLINGDQRINAYIFIDGDFLNNFKKEFKYLKPFKHIYFLSLIRYDFDNLMIFF